MWLNIQWMFWHYGGWAKNILMNESERSGTTVSGDSAIIKYKVLFNGIVHDIHWPNVMCKIFNYIGHMELRNKKNATFFAIFMKQLWIT